MASVAFLPTPLRGFLRKSFLERNQKIIGLAAVVLIIGGSAFALLLQGGVFASTYGVTAFFTDAAGINPGDEVTVAGLKAGTVKGVEIQNGRVAMDLAVDSGVVLPEDSRATVKVQTLLGKETVELTAGQSKQKLADGDVIPLSRTTTPIDITQLNDISVHLLQQSDAKAFNQLLAEVAQITAGKEAQVRTLIKGLADVTQAIDERRAQLSSLITAFRIVSTTLANKDQAILSLIDHLNPVLTNLAARQQAIRTLLEATSSASHATADLVSRNRGVLDATLRGLHTDLSILNRHEVDIAATIQYLNGAVHGYQSVGYSGSRHQANGRGGSGGFENHWANIFVQSLGPIGGDAFLGQCGVVDHLIDQVLGTNCHQTPKGKLPPLPIHAPKLPGGGPVPHVSVPPLPIPTPSVHVPVPSISPPGLPKPRLGGPPPLPDNVGVIVKSALTGGGTGS
jgi:phospholipid/cholesterol/gamma-HCH transport system substrate-binding protein